MTQSMRSTQRNQATETQRRLSADYADYTDWVERRPRIARRRFAPARGSKRHLCVSVSLWLISLCVLGPLCALADLT
jgi:hypothetical protein